MSNFIVPNYDFASEISTSFDQGYSDSSTAHRAVAIDTTDANGLEIGYSTGYKAARDYHREATASGTDATGASRAYLDGYDAASIYHTDNTVSGADNVGRERGYFEGYKAARDYHTTNTASGNDSTGTPRGYAAGHGAGNTAGYASARDFHRSATYSGNDPTGQQRGYYKGYLAARNYHTTNSTSGNDPTGVQRGYAEGYGIGHTAGVAAGYTPRWSMTFSSSQAISNGVYTRANFNTVQHSQGVTISTSAKRVTPPAGNYDVMAGVFAGFSTSNSDGSLEVRIRRSGGSVTQGAYFRGVSRLRSVNNSDFGSHHMLRNVSMNGSQYFDVFVRSYHSAVIKNLQGGTTGSGGQHGGRPPAFFIGHKR